MPEPAPFPRPSSRDLGTALAYAAATTVLWGLQIAPAGGQGPVPGISPAFILLLQLAACGGIALRRTRPGAMFAITGSLGLMVGLMDGGTGAAVLIFESLYAAVVHGSRRLACTAAALAAVVTIGLAVTALLRTEQTELLFSLLFQNLVIMVLPVLWGTEVRHLRDRRTRAEQMAEAQREIAAQQLELEQARAALRLQEQRTHLAQELHDGVTGHLSAVALQTGALRSSASLRQDPAALERSLDTVRASALEAIADMRRLIDVLRTDEPAPEDASWDSLAARLRALRPEAAIDVRPEASARLETIGAGAHALRLGQEAVTNVLKHAGPGPVVLTLRLDDDRPVLVLDSPLATAESSLGGAGMGLLSMSRRAEETGAELEAGPVAGQIWRVRAVWPAVSAQPGPRPRQELAP